MTLTDLQTAHPYGEYSERHGCYYTVDYDSEIGYFRQLNDRTFETDWNWVDFDTMSEEEAEYICEVAKTISTRS
ncbi:hypothetical protein Syn7803C17_88 [Synechococcus phage ACG-2014f]|uniref:Uncharacterized protein n=1 Tax=Synechococcus phage ACG-2014f TaxID=1493511 RepID=A0A0E3HJF4_9CAUD|nr:hypothetical protein Syn7803US42_93 [Synechococcus phage ACG-2014f]AIX42592.1 hypothetical protein Syn7803C17_88 [Synechococcus phage ACG-2014f]